MAKKTAGPPKPGKSLEEMAATSRIASQIHGAEVLRVSVKDLREDPQNPRTITPEMRDHLGDSLAAFGQVEPLVVTADRMLVAGHQRLALLRERGEDEADVLVLPADWPAEKVRALGLALNRVKGRWDERKLVALLGELRHEDVDLGAGGFDEAELVAVLGEDLPPPPGKSHWQMPAPELNAAKRDPVDEKFRVQGGGEANREYPAGQEPAAEPAPPEVPAPRELIRPTPFRIGRVWHRLRPSMVARLNDWAAEQVAKGRSVDDLVEEIVQHFARAE